MMQQDLEALSLDEAGWYFENYLDIFQLDLGTATAFIERVLTEKPQAYTARTRPLLELAIKAAVNLASFDPDILRLALMTGIAPQAEPVVKVLEATHVEPDVFDEIRGLPLGRFAAEVRQICERMLQRHPMAIRYADLLLQVDLFEARPPADVLSRMKCPRMLSTLWTKRLFDHHATMGADVQAWPLLEALPAQLDDPFTLSRAAEMHRRRGDLEAAIGSTAGLLRSRRSSGRTICASANSSRRSARTPRCWHENASRSASTATTRPACCAKLWRA